MTDREIIETGTLPGQPAGPANPAQLVVDSVQCCLALAASWQAWDGRPIIRDDGGPANTWTPHKALRRIADHLLDHLHEVEALLAGADAMPDQWHGRMVTLGTDLAPFTGPDLDEARSRLARLGRCYLLRYAAAGQGAWDAARGEAWTLREIAEHVANVSYYAEQVGEFS